MVNQSQDTNEFSFRNVQRIFIAQGEMSFGMSAMRRDDFGLSVEVFETNAYCALL